MTLFLIVPLFVLWLLSAVVATVATRFVPQLKQLFPFVWRISVWATLGSLASTALLLWMIELAARTGQPFPAGSFGHDLFALYMGLAVIAGPLLAIVAGWTAGALLGTVLALVATRRSNRAALTRQ